jgi:hypothetical protein
MNVETSRQGDSAPASFPNKVLNMEPGGFESREQRKGTLQARPGQAVLS